MASKARRCEWEPKRLVEVLNFFATHLALAVGPLSDYDVSDLLGSLEVGAGRP